MSVSLEILGDRWSLLVVRDLMVRGYRTFGEFEQSGEGIATNILADRLRRLVAAGLVSTEAAPEDRRRTHYRLTAKGIALAPVVLDLLIWGAHHEETGAPRAVIEQMERNREAVLRETYRRWEERDPTPILPAFGPGSASGSGSPSGPASGSGSGSGPGAVAGGKSGPGGGAAKGDRSEREKGEAV